MNRKQKNYFNLNFYLKKNLKLKKLENELIQAKLELKNQQKAYKLLALNAFLGFIILLLLFLNFYKLSLLTFGYLLLQNSLVVKKYLMTTYYKSSVLTNIIKKNSQFFLRLTCRRAWKFYRNNVFFIIHGYNVSRADLSS